MVSIPAGGGPRALWSRPFRWLWIKRAWVAGGVGIVFTASTFYVLWVIRDLPDPSQDVLAAGDVVVLDRNGKLIEDWNSAGHYHINVSLHDMGPYPPAAVLAAEDRNFYNHGAIDLASTGRALWVDIVARRSSSPHSRRRRIGDRTAKNRMPRLDCDLWWTGGAAGARQSINRFAGKFRRKGGPCPPRRRQSCAWSEFGAGKDLDREIARRKDRTLETPARLVEPGQTRTNSAHYSRLGLEPF